MAQKTKANPVIGIIGGKGRMGKLFADFFIERGLKVLISDLKTKLKPEELAQKSDITIISVPIDRTVGMIERVSPHIKEGGAIMDFTSVKSHSVKAMLKARVEVLAVHPMFGNSNPIPGQTIILCPTKRSGKWSAWIEHFFLENQVKILKMTVKEHDKTMSLAQGLIHFADISFADAVRRNKLKPKQLLKFTSKASEMKLLLAARLIAQDPNLYGNIQIQNPKNLQALRAYKKSVDDLVKIVEKKDLKAFCKYFERIAKCFGDYSAESYEDSSVLIDQLIKLKNSDSKRTRSLKPKKKDLAVLGPANTFSDLAASIYLEKTGSTLNKYFTSSIDEVFDLVKSGKVKEGIVPIENKLHGTVRETLDQIFLQNIHVAAEITIPIEHCLIQMSHAKTKDIEKVISHVQALNQCKSYLDKKLPNAKLIQSSSTAAAIAELTSSQNKSLAAIAPEISAASHPNLKVIAKNIGNSKENATTFIIIRKGSIKLSKPSEKAFEIRPIRKSTTGSLSKKLAAGKLEDNHRTSIAFHFSKDSPGSLFTVFKDFADARVNMTKIESRPTKAKFGDYVFYLDFDGAINNPKIQKLLRVIEGRVAKLKVIGSYHTLD